MPVDADRSSSNKINFLFHGCSFSDGAIVGQKLTLETNKLAPIGTGRILVRDITHSC